MSRFKREYEPNRFYHIYNRGHSGSKIYFMDEDYERFINLVYKYESLYNLSVESLCLMPNHYHMILFSGPKYWQISFFMHKLNLSYAQSFNKIYGYSGAVFDRHFQIKLVDNLEYLGNLKQYFKMNPVKAELVDRSEEYKWIYGCN